MQQQPKPDYSESPPSVHRGHCAAKLDNPRAIVTHGLYWAAVTSNAEAAYLCAVLNAPVTTEMTRPLMSYGKDERDIHRHVWVSGWRAPNRIARYLYGGRGA